MCWSTTSSLHIVNKHCLKDNDFSSDGETDEADFLAEEVILIYPNSFEEAWNNSDAEKQGE